MSKKRTAQRDIVLNWLQTRGDLTFKQAVQELNILDVRKRIEELRKTGYTISMTYNYTPAGSRYGVYRLEA